MPGIVGLITKMPGDWAKAQLQRMLNAMCREAGYTSGTLVDESHGVYLGWTVRSDSFADGMPLQNERGDISLVFSGEEFPDPAALAELRNQGHSFNTDVPEYLVHLYEQDPEFPLSLNGRFHGLVIDRASGVVKLFNDRYGMHRLYYHQAKDGLYFSIEAKAILAIRPELRSVDANALGEFISCGCVLENRSLFRGIEVLPPASAWVFRGGDLQRKGHYFDQKDWENLGPLSPEAHYSQLREVFSRNLPRYFSGRQRAGLSLTGGLDSRMIMAWWGVAPNTVPCYTFRGMYNECQDVTIGRKVAAICHQTYQEIFVGDDFVSKFPTYAERSIYLTDACVDVSRAPVLYTNERAAEIAPVRMTGNYGSEILRSMVAFKPAHFPKELFKAEFHPNISRANETYRRLFEGIHPLAFIAFRQMPWHHWGLLSLEQTQLSPRSPYLDNDVVRTTFRAPNTELVRRSVLAEHDVCLRLIADGNPALRKVRGDRGAGAPGGVLGALTRAHLEITFKAEYEYDYGMRQSVAQMDHWLAPLHLERLFLGRHKYYHFRVWYRDALAKYVQEMLLDPRTLSRPYIEPKALETVVSGHIKGSRNYTTTITKILTLELLHRLFVDPS